MEAMRARIAHISDLHFGVGVEETTLAMLRQILLDQAPDVLIVSGDQAHQPFPWQMRKAAKFLEDLTRDLPWRVPRVVVIPGNHDYKLWGNVGLRRLTRVPYAVYFEQQGLAKRWWQRLGDYLSLSANALWPGGRRLRDGLEVQEYADLGVIVTAFNSNTLAEMMAAGRVEREILRQFAEYATWRQSRLSFDFQFKIAVVHHHPAPIAFMPDGALGRLQESFMVFYNAGTFLYLVDLHGFHLVLHGHKHLAGLSRVSHPASSGPGEVAVAAAGSAAHPHPDDSRGNHLNLIDLFEDDTARLTSWFFSSAVLKKVPETLNVSLHDLTEVQRRRHAIYSKRRGYSFSRLEKRVAITVDGYSLTQESFHGLRVTIETGISDLPLDRRTSSPCYLRGASLLSSSLPLLEISLPPGQSGLRSLVGRFELGRRCLPNREPFDFAFQYLLMNGHALSAQEFQRRYVDAPLSAEYSTITCEHACEELTLFVEFPNEGHLEGLRYSAAALYLPAPLRELDVDPDDDLKLHATESERAATGLRKEGRCLVLRVVRPVPGFMYRLSWKFRAEQNPKRPPLEIETTAFAGQRKLLEAARGAATRDPVAQAHYAQICGLVDVLAKELQQQLGAREELEASVMVFDEAALKLRIVAANFGHIDELARVELISGEGCGGFSFEKVRTLLFHPSRDSIGYYIRAAEYAAVKPGAGALVDQDYLVTIPWLYPAEWPADPSLQKLVVGVVSIGSRKVDSRLARLFDLGNDEWMKLNRTLLDLTARWGAAMLRFVREEPNP